MRMFLFTLMLILSGCCHESKEICVRSHIAKNHCMNMTMFAATNLILFEDCEVCDETAPNPAYLIDPECKK